MMTDMQAIHIEGSRSTPEIHFDPVLNTLSVKGQSFPENAFKFYEPILAWLDMYLEQLQQEVTVKFELMLPYINTSSTKCFMTLLEKLDEAHAAGKNVQLFWYYDMENESEFECAQEFKEDLNLPFHLICKETT
ncbi:DUF1987 domain-containing protein [Paenibacillus hexagrammi]|uniref:DUF1987 domain-containing protein n=1 Tax=Paenibacillus hexagrammi TaxID=2908839 RepID=A0ABY3SLE5_9BACL|nr:DUF1987 domain-containing protein [Paenibacillus sp. YPD9-1]UJF34667.1 DUF1987 domain-containing protein [Paenibacillus sp. YPD9-1]